MIFVNYNDLIKCTEIDAIYIATLNNTHLDLIKLCAENKNIDNIIGFSLLITNLEKENIINGYVNKILEPFMDSILDSTDDTDIFKMITSFYNISKIHFDGDIPNKYVIILNQLKDKTTSSKIRFKIMDILDE